MAVSHRLDPQAVFTGGHTAEHEGSGTGTPVLLRRWLRRRRGVICSSCETAADKALSAGHRHSRAAETLAEAKKGRYLLLMRDRR